MSRYIIESIERNFVEEKIDNMNECRHMIDRVCCNTRCEHFGKEPGVKDCRGCKRFTKETGIVSAWVCTQLA